MGEPTETVADVSLKFAGQEVNVKNVKSLNTIATICTLIATCTIGVFIYFHEAGAQADKAQVANTLSKSNSDIAGALKDSNLAIVQALKESNANTLSAIKELTSEQKKSTNAIKVGNCLNDPSMKNRQDAREFCNRITRDDR